MIKASDFEGGHWMVCLNNEWLSIIGSFSREDLESALEKIDLPAGQAEGWHLVNALRSQTFQQWEAESGNVDKYNQYLELCRWQTEMMHGWERTREIAEQLGLKDDYAQELYLRYGVIIEGQRGQEELKLIENMWASMPEVFVLDARFIVWTDAPMEQEYRLTQKTVILRHADAQEFPSRLEDLLEVIWERELKKDESELCNSFNWRYGYSEGHDAYQRIYQERIRTIFANVDSSGELFKVSDFAGGHWIIRVRDNWVSVIGDFSRAQLKNMYENFMGCPANHLDGFRIVQELQRDDAGADILYNVMGLENNINVESRLSPFNDTQSWMVNRQVTPHHATHETGHFTQYRLEVENSPEAKILLLKWRGLHILSDDRCDFVSQYAYDATGASWVGDTENESWAETYTSFREELATGCFWFSSTRPLIQEKLLVMAHLFIVREDGGDFLFVDGRKTQIALEPDGSISLEALDLWSQERVKERVEKGEDSLEKIDWIYLEKITPELSLALDQDQAIYTLEDIELLTKQAEKYPEAFFWMTGIRAEDTDVMAKLRENGDLLQAHSSLDPSAMRLPLNLLISWDDSGRTEQQVLRVLGELGASEEIFMSSISLHPGEATGDNYWSIAADDGKGGYKVMIFKEQEPVDQMIAQIIKYAKPLPANVREREEYLREHVLPAWSKTGMTKLLRNLANVDVLNIPSDLKYQYVLEQGGFPDEVRPELLREFVNSLSPETAAGWFEGYLNSSLFTPQELEELKKMSADDPELKKIYEAYIKILRGNHHPVISEHPKRPFSWQGSMQTALGFLVSGPMLGGLVWLISGQPLAWADIMALPGMLFILSGSVLGAVVFGFMSWDASGRLSWLWKFLVSKGVCRAGPENLISGFENAEPAEAGQENPAYTQGITIYADKKFLSQRPKPIQWFYFLHERIHVYLNSKKISFGAETLAYGGQALPLILLQIIGLGLAFNVMFGLAAIPVLLAPALLFMLSRTRSQVEPAKKQFEEVRPNQPLRGKQPLVRQIFYNCLSGLLFSSGLSQAGNLRARLPLEGMVSFFRGALLLVPGTLWLWTITRKAGPGLQAGQTPDIQRLLVEIQADEAAVEIFARQGYGDFIRPNIQVRPCSDLGLISRLLSPLGRVWPDKNGQPVIYMPAALLLNSRDPGINFFIRIMLKYHLERFYSTSRVDTALTRLRVKPGWQQTVMDRIQQLALGPQGYLAWILKDDKSILAQQLLNKNSPAGQAYRQWLDTPDKDNTWKWMDLMLGEVEKPGDSPPAPESLADLSKVCSRVPGLMGVIVGDMHGILLTREQREIVLPAILLQTHSDRRFWLNRLEKLRLPLTLKRRELLPLLRQPARALDRAA